jgi:hypothetical protein
MTEHLPAKTTQETEPMNLSPSALPDFVREPATPGREKSKVRKKDNEDPEQQVESKPKSAPGGVLAGKNRESDRRTAARLREERQSPALAPLQRKTAKKIKQPAHGGAEP